MTEFDILRDALVKNENEKVKEIECKCLQKIRAEIENNSQFREVRNIAHDYFSESLISESMKNLIIERLDKRNKMVIAGRYVILIFT